MKLKTKLKIALPVIISFIKIILMPFIIILSYKKDFILATLLIVFGFVTNYIDNIVADKLYTKTKLSKNTDEFSNIIFIIGIVISLYKINIIFVPLSIIEIVSLIIIFIITFKHEMIILEIDKINRISIIILYFISVFLKISNISNGYILLTLNISIITLIFYIYLLIPYLKKKNIDIENNEAHKKIIEETDDLMEQEMMKTKAIKNIEYIIKKYEEK